MVSHPSSPTYVSSDTPETIHLLVAETKGSFDPHRLCVDYFWLDATKNAVVLSLVVLILEIQGLLGPVQCKPDDTKGDPPPTAGSLNYGLKLLKKPINILNTTTTTSSSGGGGNGSTQAKVPLLSQISDNKINALFESYRDEECEDAILAPGIERLCSDLRYKPEDFTVLVLAWRLDASQMCRFTKAEFIQGLHTLNADSIETIRQSLEEEVG